MLVFILYIHVVYNIKKVQQKIIFVGLYFTYNLKFSLQKNHSKKYKTTIYD